MNKRERKAQMQPRKQKRQEEHQQELRVDGLADIRLRHADALHDFEPGLILIALGDLLII